MEEEIYESTTDSETSQEAPLPPYVSRMQEEYTDLNIKLEKLNTFLVSDTFTGLPNHKQALLIAQQAGMISYRFALSLRIDTEVQELYNREF